MDPQYQAWYNSVYGVPAPQGPAPGPGPMTPAQWAQFYQSVGIGSPVGQPPTTRTVQSVPVAASPAAPKVTTVATYSTKPQTQGYTYANEGLPRRPTVQGAPMKLPAIPGPNGYASTTKTDERLPSSLPGLTAPLTPQMLAALGVSGPTKTQVANSGAIAPVPFTRPPMFGAQPMPPMPISRPPNGAPVQQQAMTLPQTSRPPLKITVSGANPIPYPMPANMRPVPMPAAYAPPQVQAVQQPQSLFYTDPRAFGAASVAQSGDNSSGSQAEAAAARASGAAWRAAQMKK